MLYPANELAEFWPRLPFQHGPDLRLHASGQGIIEFQVREPFGTPVKNPSLGTKMRAEAVMILLPMAVLGTRP